MSVRRHPWGNSIYWWKNGQPEPLAKQLRGGAVIPENVREFLAGVIEGTIRKNRNRPVKMPGPGDGILHWQIREEFRFQLAVHQCLHRLARAEGTRKRGDDSAKFKALAYVVRKFKMRPGTVRAIVYPARK